MGGYEFDPLPEGFGATIEARTNEVAGAIANVAHVAGRDRGRAA